MWRRANSLIISAAPIASTANCPVTPKALARRDSGLPCGGPAAWQRAPGYPARQGFLRSPLLKLLNCVVVVNPASG
jgi:hypothetical protein